MTSVDGNHTLLEALGEEAEALADEIPRQIFTKKVRKLSAGELCFLLQRNLALEIAAPLAVDKLRDDALLQAGAYPGDLLVALMESDGGYWRENYELWREVLPLLEQAVNTIRARAETEELGEYMPFYVGDDFMAALLHFRDLFSE